MTYINNQLKAELISEVKVLRKQFLQDYRENDNNFLQSVLLLPAVDTDDYEFLALTATPDFIIAQYCRGDIVLYETASKDINALVVNIVQYANKFHEFNEVFSNLREKQFEKENINTKTFFLNAYAAEDQYLEMLPEILENLEEQTIVPKDILDQIDNIFNDYNGGDE